MPYRVSLSVQGVWDKGHKVTTEGMTNWPKHSTNTALRDDVCSFALLSTLLEDTLQKHRHLSKNSAFCVIIGLNCYCRSKRVWCNSTVLVLFFFFLNAVSITWRPGHDRSTSCRNLRLAEGPDCSKEDQIKNSFEEVPPLFKYSVRAHDELHRVKGVCVHRVTVSSCTGRGYRPQRVSHTPPPLLMGDPEASYFEKSFQIPVGNPKSMLLVTLAFLYSKVNTGINIDWISCDF